MTEQEVPGQAGESNERIAERGYESDFAQLPEAEVEEIPIFGGGPYGGVSGHLNVPLVVVAVGFALVFLTFGVESVWTLAVGLLLVLVGAIWAKIRNRTYGKGSGTVTVGGGR